MNDLLYAMMKTVNYDLPEELDNIMPYDLNGYCEQEQKDILALYIVYGVNPDRVSICRQKLEEYNNVTRPDSI